MRRLRSGYHSITPRVFVDDVGALVSFLREVFDATGDVDPGRPAELRIGDSPSNLWLRGEGLAEVDGNRTRRTGITRPARFEGGGAHQALGHLRWETYPTPEGRRLSATGVTPRPERPEARHSVSTPGRRLQVFHGEVAVDEFFGDGHDRPALGRGVVA